MHHYEIQNYMKVLCEMTNKNLDEIVNNAYEFLPFFIMFNAQSCYVRYDTQDECITDVTLKVMNNAGLVIEVDPISSTITAFVAGEPGESLKMQKNTADILLDCIRTCWRQRLSTEDLISINSDGRFVAADLIG